MSQDTSNRLPTEKRYQYFAFISYKHDDVRWAKWLQNRLEAYRLPSIIRKEAPHLPKQVRPIFRDQTDIGTGPLLDNLRSELEDSRFLIVLCSPAAAKSEWVNREVQNFIGMGRGDRIIPFVIAGEPNAADPSRECFPPALRETEQTILGVNVEEIGKEQAIVKVVAKLLELKFDRLWDRHRRRQRRNFLLGSIMAAVLFVAAAVGGFCYWDYNRLKVAYYADYVECRGVPRGIDELSTAQVQRRYLSWKIESSRYRIDRVRSINGSGSGRQPTDSEDADRAADRSFHYRDDGTLEYTIEFASTGKELRRSVYAPDLSIVEFKGGSKGRLQVQTKFLSADTAGLNSRHGMLNTGARSEIAKWELKYDDLGHVVQRTYLNQSGYPTSDANGIYVQEFTYTPAGKVKAIRYLNIGGQPCSTKRGIAGKQYEYDVKGNRIQTTWINRTGTPVLHENGCAIGKQRYDADGNKVEESYFGIDGKPCLNKDGYAGFKATYDERGNQTSQSCLGTDGKPCLYKDGYASLTATYDERGNRTSNSFFGTDGKPCLNKDGYAGFKATYDERGNRTYCSFFGIDGKPCLNKDGYAGFKATYDERGNQTSQSCLGTDGKPCLYKDGLATVKTTYDERGNRTCWSYFGIDGKPCLHKDGYAELKITYDERGNLTNQSYLGSDGKPCLLKDGYAELKNTYDEWGNQTSQSCLGIDGKPCLNKDGYATTKDTYDERGNETSYSYFGIDGKPCLHKDGVACFKYTYDERGNKTSESCFDTKGKPTLNVQECSHRIVYRYGPNGIAEMTFFDCKGKSIPYSERIAAVAKALSSSNGTDEGSQRPMRVRVTTVLAGGEADIKGVHVGDIIVRYAGVPITSHLKLIAEVMKPGSESRELVILRNDKEITLHVVPGPLKVALEEIPVGTSPPEKPADENKATEKTQDPAPKSVAPKE